MTSIHKPQLFDGLYNCFEHDCQFLNFDFQEKKFKHKNVLEWVDHISHIVYTIQNHYYKYDLTCVNMFWDVFGGPSFRSF